MKSVLACCAVLTFAACGPAAAAPAHTSAFNPFDRSVVRPPAAIPHGRGTHAAPLPRPKPVAAPRSAPATPGGGASAFPPVATLE
jgi:hypothetical protein